jgi:hypothetical protein
VKNRSPERHFAAAVSADCVSSCDNMHNLGRRILSGVFVRKHCQIRRCDFERSGGRTAALSVDSVTAAQ